MPRGIKKISWIIIISIVAIIIVASVYYSQREEKPEFDFIVAETQDLLQLVSVTGHVKPVESVELSFEVTGKIDLVLKEVGDQVLINDPIVKLVNSELSSQLVQIKSEQQTEQAILKQLNAVLDYENAVLNEIKRGARDEDIKVSQTNLNNAEKAQVDAETDYSNTINKTNSDIANLYGDAEKFTRDAFVAIDDAVNIKTDDMFSDKINDKDDLNFVVGDNLINMQARNGRQDSKNELDRLVNLLADYPTEYIDIDKELEKCHQGLLTVIDFLTVLSEALADSITLDSTTKSTHQLSVDTARDSVNFAKNNVFDLIQLISSQKVINQNSIDAAQSLLNSSNNAVDLAKDQLSLKKVGALPEKIQSQEARVAQAEANIEAQTAKIGAVNAKLDIVRSQIEKTVLRSPINGIITEQNAKAGEISTFGSDRILSPLVAIMSESQYQIEANIPEVDIANIKIGDIAEVTLDAYSSGELFESRVTKINPAEKIIEGVPTYKITLVFVEEDDRIKSGMTANLDVITAEKDGVIAVPQRSVIRKNSKTTIRLLMNGDFDEMPVKTGLVSWDGQIEIIDGVSIGDKVITYVEE